MNIPARKRVLNLGLYPPKGCHFAVARMIGRKAEQACMKRDGSERKTGILFIFLFQLGETETYEKYMS